MDEQTRGMVDRARRMGGADGWVWPTGAGEVATCRALVKRGLARETAGKCEGCPSHQAGTKVPVFELLGEAREAE